MPSECEHEVRKETFFVILAAVQAYLLVEGPYRGSVRCHTGGKDQTMMEGEETWITMNSDSQYQYRSCVTTQRSYVEKATTTIWIIFFASSKVSSIDL